MRRIGSKSVDGLIVRFVRTPHTMFFRPGRALACTLVLATVLSAVELGSAYAGSVTIRTYQYNYRSGGGGFSWGGGGGGGGCPAGEGYCGGGCAPTGSTCCTNGRYCVGNQICTNNGNSCLDRSDERVCSDGRVCGPGFLCMKDDSCLSMASDRYCGNRHYCDMGYVCQPGGGCRTQASIDAEANLRAEQEREEQERAQQRLEEQERAQQRREEHEAPPGGQTNFCAARVIAARLACQWHLSHKLPKRRDGSRRFVCSNASATQAKLQTSRRGFRRAFQSQPTDYSLYALERGRLADPSRIRLVAPGRFAGGAAGGCCPSCRHSAQGGSDSRRLHASRGL
jgi:hypothetical protein